MLAGCARDPLGTLLSRARLQALIRDGRVRVDGRPVTDPSGPAPASGLVEILLPPPAAPTPEAEDLALPVLFEDAHLIVVDKPAGMAAHPAPGTPSGTLVNALLHRCRDSLSGVGGVLRPGVVHRLDKDTSGIMVAAKTDAAHRGLAALFAAHDIDRRYVAYVAGRPERDSGTIDTLIGRAPFDRQRMAVVKSGGRRAVSHFRSEDVFHAAPDRGLVVASRVRVTLETGRTHQIRVHMAHLRAPVLGDPVYGGPPPKALREAVQTAGLARQALHAERLGFVHPITGEGLLFETPPPADMLRLETELRTRFFLSSAPAKP